MVHNSWWMQLDELIIFDRQVLARSLLVGNLHKKSLNQSFTNVGVIVFWLKVGARSFEIKSIHDPSQLSAYIVCLFQWAHVDKILVAPLRISFI